mgnify:CR=1 FL=1
MVLFLSCEKASLYMKNSILTAIIVCEDNLTAQKAVDKLQADGVSAIAAGRAVQAIKRFQVVGELPRTVPEKDWTQALFQTLMGEIVAEEQLREALDALNEPYIILDNIETDPSVSIQNMVEGKGAENLFSAIIEVSNIRTELTEQAAAKEPESDEGRDKALARAEALSTVLDFAKKSLAMVLMGQ